MKSSPKYLSELNDRQAKIQTELNRMQTIAPDNLLMIPPVMPASVAPPAGGAGAPETGSSTAGAMPVGAELYSIYLQKTQELSAAQSRVDEQSKIWKPKHPRMQALREQLADVQRSIEVIKQQNRDASVQRVDAINAELRSLKQGSLLGSRRCSRRARKMPSTRIWRTR